MELPDPLDFGPLWAWMNARHAMYNERFRKRRPPPWSGDPILNEYRFTNVFRELDRVTIDLNRRVGDWSASAMKMYHIIAFRAFNVPETYDTLNHANALYEYKAMIKVLRGMAKARQKIFTGAYIVTNAGSEKPKIELMAKSLMLQYRDREAIYARIKNDNTMRGATEILCEYPMQGGFTAYEVVCDLRWQTGMLDRATDRMTWANLGPGARRGINRLVSGQAYPNVFKDKRTYEAVMRHACELAPKRLDKKIFRHAARIEMREIEHSLCEMDKYLRTKNGEGRPRSKYRAE